MTGDLSANEVDQLLTKLESLGDRDYRIAIMAAAMKSLPFQTAQKMAHRFVSEACAEAWDQACKATLDLTKATGKPSRPANPYVKDSS